MNGSGTPVSGASPSTTKIFSEPWQRISEVRPGASSFACGGGPAGGAQARVGDHPVEDRHGEDAHHAELLADHREDEVGRGPPAGRRSSAPTGRGRRRTARPSRARSGPAPPESRGLGGVRPWVQERRQPGLLRRAEIAPGPPPRRSRRRRSARYAPASPRPAASRTSSTPPPTPSRGRARSRSGAGISAGQSATGLATPTSCGSACAVVGQQLRAAYRISASFIISDG